MSTEKAKFEIIDFSGEKMNLFTLHSSTVMIICTILSLISLVCYIIYYPSLFALFISIGIVIIFFLFPLTSEDKGLLRKFTIFESTIEILLPTREPFIMRWSQIDEIKVKLNIFDINPFQFYEITFLGEKMDSKIILNLKDFKKENLLKILKTLKIETIDRQKKFSAIKEEFVSGIFLVSNLSL